MLVGSGDTPLLSDITIGIISLVAAILAGTITFWSHATRAEKHRSVAAQLTNVRRTLDVEIAFPPKDDKELKDKLVEMNRMINEVVKEAPTIQFDVNLPPTKHPKGTPSRGGGGGGSTSIMPTVR